MFEYGLRSKLDGFIGEAVRAGGSILVTKDDDFVFVHGTTVERLVWVRCGNIVNAKLLELFELHWERVIHELGSQKLVELR